MGRGASPSGFTQHHKGGEMKRSHEKKTVAPRAPERKDRRAYEPPQVVVYSEEYLMEQLKSTKACSAFGGSVVGC